MNIKEFYLENLFNGYTDKMPKWLFKEAQHEFNIIKLVIMLSKLTTTQIKMLDIGCGDCRIFKNITISRFFKKRIACDIFNKKELPDKFIDWLQTNRIKYQCLPQINNMYYIPKEWGQFDIIACLGVDVHLNDEACNFLLDCAKKCLTKNGILLWQVNRKDTIKGKWLNWVDRKLHYQYRNDQFYSPYTLKYSTNISHIYEYRQLS